MSLKKNQIFETTIENLSSDGSGVAHVEGQAVLCPARHRGCDPLPHCKGIEKLCFRPH